MVMRQNCEIFHVILFHDDSHATYKRKKEREIHFVFVKGKSSVIYRFLKYQVFEKGKLDYNHPKIEINQYVIKASGFTQSSTQLITFQSFDRHEKCFLFFFPFRHISHDLIQPLVLNIIPNRQKTCQAYENMRSVYLKSTFQNSIPYRRVTNVSKYLCMTNINEITQ